MLKIITCECGEKVASELIWLHLKFCREGAKALEGTEFDLDARRTESLVNKISASRESTTSKESKGRGGKILPVTTKCPTCGVNVKENNLKRHIRKMHSSNRYSEKNKPKLPKAILARQLGTSLFVAVQRTVVTKEKKLKQDRIQKSGFADGASIPGSNIRKIDK